MGVGGDTPRIQCRSWCLSWKVRIDILRGYGGGIGRPAIQGPFPREGKQIVDSRTILNLFPSATANWRGSLNIQYFSLDSGDFKDFPRQLAAAERGTN